MTRWNMSNISQIWSKVDYSNFVKKIALNVFLLSIASLDIFAQATAGGFSQAYMMRDLGARPVAMAGAYTAVSNDPFAVFYNPAGLAYFSSQPIVASSVANLGLGRSNATLAFGQQITENIGVGLGLNTLFSGSFISRDIMGNPHNKMASNQYTISGIGAYSMEFASVGVALKYLIDNLEGAPTQATGASLDIGAKFNVFDLFSFGIAVQNIGGQMVWNLKENSNEAIPYTIRTGIAMEYGLNAEEYTTRSTTDGEIETVFVPASRYILFGIDAVYHQYDLSPTFVIGTELLLHELIGFRGGIAIYGDDLGVPKFFPMTVWGGGISLRPELDEIFGPIPFKANIDYSISKEHLSETGILHNISIIFEF